MYLTYYGLNREAFQITPDPSFLYMSSSHKEALGAIIYGVEKRKGFISIIGEVGVGKTTILRAFLEGHSDSNQKTVYIFNPVVSYQALLTAIFKGLDIVPAAADEVEMVNQLHEVLVENYKTGGTVVLIIDEAQNMPIMTLENLRMLSNLETATEKLLQVVLVGQPELERLLEQPELRQFQQRIALRAKICPLTEKESMAFILHRIAVASTPRNPVFTNKALQLIARKGKGIPRRINILCDNALITGFGRQLTPVPVSVVKEILVDIDGTSSPTLWKWGLVAGLVLLLGFGVLFYWETFNSQLSSGVVRNISQQEPGTLSESRKTTVISQQEVGQLGSTTRSDKSLHETPLGQLPSHARREFFTDDVTVATENNQSVKPGVSDLEQINNEESNIPASSNRQEAVASSSRRLPQSIQAQSVHRSSSGKGEDASVHHSTAIQSPSEQSSMVKRFVQHGENLSQIASETYGSTSLEYIEWVKRHNPHIEDPDMILPGQYIVLPEYPKTADLHHE
ncbi:MAG: hypothetical protein NPIRA04_25880 [Nitrospirales bacterium]|nr:MAG: hypothetical protein NPIRA04_25880 [Nitrospirales bacterium]